MKRAPQVTSGDLAAWKRLVREAGKAADCIDGPMGDLEAAERRARRAVVLGALAKDNPCVQLVRTARAFIAETLRGRRALQPKLLELSVLVGEAVYAAANPPENHHRAREPRKDIFG